MRASAIAVLTSALALFSVDCANALDRNGNGAGSSQPKPQSSRQTYRGYFLDLSQIAGRQDFGLVTDALRRQIDIVESVGLSPRVLTFFRTIPIVADEMACTGAKVLTSACYGSAAPVRPGQLRSATVWDGGKEQWTNPDPVTLAEDRRRGVVMVRPLPISAREPVILHEMLHAYHAQMMPEGYQNSWVLGFYDRTKSNALYPSDAYVLTNEKEFFAVTASIFLYGQGDKEPFTRSNIKEKQPDYYRYLTWLFGLDPERSPAAAPTASAPMADPAPSRTQAAAGAQTPVLTPPPLQLSGGSIAPVGSGANTGSHGPYPLH